jgi:UDP-2,3-diacylglucosamine pyrophosphatase LpxH
MKSLNVASLFLSDIHLGTGLTNHKQLLDLLDAFKGERLFLIGDIIDIVAMRRSVRWEEDDNKVVRKIIKMAKKGTKVYYIPGNHDYTLRGYDRMKFFGVSIRKKMIIELKNGKKVLLKHGDEFDGVIRGIGWLYGLGDFLYETVIRLNKPFNRFRSIFGFKDRNFSLSMFLKHKVKNSLAVINDFENLVVTKGRQYKVDYVMCGHIHMPEIKQMEDITYCNTGTFCEGWSYIVEHHDGSLELFKSSNF